MKKILITLTILCLFWASVQEGAKALAAPSNGPESLTCFPYEFHEDFEDRDPFLKWASNGSFKVNFKGLTREAASSGKKSFKLDISFGTATYVYYMIPANVPNIGKLSFSGDIRVEQARNASAALGTNISLSPLPRSGVNILARTARPSGGWKTRTSDLVAAGLEKVKDQIHTFVARATPGDAGNWTNRIGLFLFGKTGSRLTLYVDNILLSGKIPDNQAYQKVTDRAWQAYKSRICKRLDQASQALGGYKKTEVDKIKKFFKTKGYITKKQDQALTEFLEARSFASEETGDSQDSLTLYAWQATGTRKLLPHTSPVPAPKAEALEVTACAGEYEPVSFVLRAPKKLNGIRITLPDLVNKNGGKIPARAVDIKYVKCWYQSGETGVRTEKGKKYLVPELLVNDDDLIKNDLDKKRSFLKAQGKVRPVYIDITSPDTRFPDHAVIRDAERLSPLNLDSGENRQVWLTIQVPPHTTPGLYTAPVRISAPGMTPLKIPLRLKVPALHLPEPELEYAIYYTGRLVPDAKARIGSQQKSAAQYAKEMKDLKRHGVSAATLYQRLDADPTRALEIRKKAGLAPRNLYVLGTRTGSPRDAKGLDNLARETGRWLRLAKAFSYRKTYIYGIDEADAAVIRSQSSAWNTVRKTGAGVFVACPRNGWKAAEGLLDIAILPKGLDPEAAAAWRRTGTRVFSYHNPQVGVENPGVYRKNYGYALWLAGYDGVMNFAYQYAKGHIWNDFDHPRYRDHVFAYPTSDGLIETVQWQGFREAVDDIRYLTAFKHAGDLGSRHVETLKQMAASGKHPARMRQYLIDQCL